VLLSRSSNFLVSVEIPRSTTRFNWHHWNLHYRIWDCPAKRLMSSCWQPRERLPIRKMFFDIWRFRNILMTIVAYNHSKLCCYECYPTVAVTAERE
jgi:hypothetical protein